jgi:hypothetical protein
MSFAVAAASLVYRLETNLIAKSLGLQSAPRYYIRDTCGSGTGRKQPAGVADDYLKINEIERPLELLDQYKIDYVLFPPNRRLTYVLDHSAGWRTIYEDKVVKLYQRVPAAPLEGPLH